MKHFKIKIHKDDIKIKIIPSSITMLCSQRRNKSYSLEGLRL
jgi:hypothetical protein